MSRTGSGTDAQLGAGVDQSIVIVDGESEPALGTKRKRAGRKSSDAWDTFRKFHSQCCLHQESSQWRLQLLQACCCWKG